jgi:hypothetical protein
VIVKEVEEAARVCLFGGVLEGARKHAVAVPGESVAFRRWQWGLALQAARTLKERRHTTSFL